MGKRGEKRVAEWIHEDGQLKIRIPVMMVDAKQQEPVKLFVDDPDAERKMDEVSTYFRVKIEDPDIWDEDTNIDQLKKRVMQKVRERVTINWRPMLYVTFGGERDKLLQSRRTNPLAVEPDGAKVDMFINWKLIQIAEISGKKQKLHRSLQGAEEEERMGEEVFSKRIGTGKWVQRWSRPEDGWPKVGKTEQYRSDPRYHAMIPDTPENRAAMEKVADAIEDAYIRLRSMLQVDQIEKTLAMLAKTPTNKLLTGIPDATTEKKKEAPIARRLRKALQPHAAGG